MAQYIHKAVRPKKDYMNPAICCAKLKEETAHRNSRTSWKNVTCPHCLKFKGKVRVLSHGCWVGVFPRKKS